MPTAADHSPDALAPIVAAVAAALGDRVRLLGHSYGGLVARATVLAHPSRFESIVLLSSGPAQLGGEHRFEVVHRHPPHAAAGLPGLYAAMQEAAQTDPAYTEPPPKNTENHKHQFLGGSPEMLQGMADALRSEPDRVEELAVTGVPVLVAHGVDDDAWPPAEQHAMAQRLGARDEVFSGAAHSPAVEYPAATVEVLLDFWRA